MVKKILSFFGTALFGLASVGFGLVLLMGMAQNFLLVLTLGVISGIISAASYRVFKHSIMQHPQLAGTNVGVIGGAVNPLVAPSTDWEDAPDDGEDQFDEEDELDNSEIAAAISRQRHSVARVAFSYDADDNVWYLLLLLRGDDNKIRDLTVNWFHEGWSEFFLLKEGDDVRFRTTSEVQSEGGWDDPSDYLVIDNSVLDQMDTSTT